LYTNVGESSYKNGTAKAFQGWTMEGYQCFDELYNAVKADCMAEGREYSKETLKALVAKDNTKERPSRLAENSGDGGEVKSQTRRRNIAIVSVIMRKAM
jgi:hypothetical protein